MSAIAAVHAQPLLPICPSGFRFIGRAASHARFVLPTLLGSSYRPDGTTYVLALGPDQGHNVASIAAALPDPKSIEPGALVVVPGHVIESPSIARRVLSAFSREHRIPRAVRCSALLCRGYVRIGAGMDPSARADIAWGYSP
ncbi:MAG: hypothetical protein FWD73_11295 [Polyangiaceae bacterium]|nr:hypothetical protein [Polyangiaceae bacterium]